MNDCVQVATLACLRFSIRVRRSVIVVLVTWYLRMGLRSGQPSGTIGIRQQIVLSSDTYEVVV